jgi:sulfite exporter TauE/SafE
MINLYNPQNLSSVFSILITAFLLGIVHGFTPDEHTWPITFSYSIGSYSTKGGFKTGFLFSLAFTFQRAVASELSYYALGKILTKPDVVPIIYIFVGIVMSFAGAYVIGLGENFELFEGLEKILMKFLNIKPFSLRTKHMNEKTPQIPVYMVLLHGFIAGWGTGAFAIIVYTVLAPKMPNGYTGFLPGLLFGIGTMATQIIIGIFAGRFMERLNIPKKGIEYIARRTSGLTLFWGGLAFVLAAALEIAFPKLIQAGFITPLKVHNLHNLGVGFFLVIFIILFILTASFVKSLKYVKNNGSEFL